MRELTPMAMFLFVALTIAWGVSHEPAIAGLWLLSELFIFWSVSHDANLKGW